MNAALDKENINDSLIKVETEKKGKIAEEMIGKEYPLLVSLANKAGVTSADLKTKIVFLNFWFASCLPCLEEFDGLNEMYKKFKENKNFEFISFTFENSNQIEEFEKKYSIQYKIISITNDECHSLNLNNGFPTNIILGKNGIIKNIYVGGHGSKKEAKNFIINEMFPVILSEL
ncbi:MAG TPA: TlpA disulfide reductase family protein [Chitinophagaceae bacterium]|nr:TlpA disulfide reductase family protein [Chitinophagaceae bacterium]